MAVKTNIRVLCLGLVIALACGAADQGQEAGDPPAAVTMSVRTLIPLPATMEGLAGSFALQDRAALVLPPAADKEWQAAARVFAEKIEKRHQLRLELKTLGQGGSDLCRNAILIGSAVSACGFADMLPKDRAPADGYKLVVSENAVLLEAKSAPGVFDGLMTLLQLIDGASPSAVPAVKILDYPRFKWRGMLIDSARSFIPPDIIKKYIDVMSELKLNVLHWHLTDDQGWRIESKVFPRLSKVGGTLAVLGEAKKAALDKQGWGRNGRGYYTQDEIKKIVAYAADRQVMIVPEIDIPGHTSAMLAAYPELSCSGEPVPVRKTVGIFKTALCPGKEEVYRFLDALFGEVAGLFPGTYVHVGGDEALPKDWLDYPGCRDLESQGYKDNLGLFKYFMGRVSEILRRRGKRMIAWDAIAPSPPPGATVQVWRNLNSARKIAEAGHDCIVSPRAYCSIDYRKEGNTPQNFYNFEPLPPGLNPNSIPHILGSEATLWGAQLTLDNMDAKVFPRLPAFSEVMWTPPELKNWDDFLLRLAVVQKNMEKRGIMFGAD
jgi:hexosaminidase